MQGESVPYAKICCANIAQQCAFQGTQCGALKATCIATGCATKWLHCFSSVSAIVSLHVTASYFTVPPNQCITEKAHSLPSLLLDFCET